METKWACTVCLKQFRGKYELNRHKSSRFGCIHNTVYSCSICGRGHDHKGNKDRHEAVCVRRRGIPSVRPTEQAIVDTKESSDKEDDGIASEKSESKNEGRFKSNSSKNARLTTAATVSSSELGNATASTLGELNEAAAEEKKKDEKSMFKSTFQVLRSETKSQAVNSTSTSKPTVSSRVSPIKEKAGDKKLIVLKRPAECTFDDPIDEETNKLPSSVGDNAKKSVHALNGAWTDIISKVIGPKAASPSEVINVQTEQTECMEVVDEALDFEVLYADPITPHVKEFDAPLESTHFVQPSELEIVQNMMMTKPMAWEEMKLKISINDRFNKFVCLNCGGFYKNRHSLRQHLLKQVCFKTVFCDFCKKGFHGFHPKNILKAHMRYHCTKRTI